jgi:hypothetical protein
MRPDGSLCTSCYERLQLAQLLGQLGVFLTCGAAPAGSEWPISVLGLREPGRLGAFDARMA